MWKTHFGTVKNKFVALLPQTGENQCKKQKN